MNLRDVFQGIYETRGELTPAVVVDEARDAAHPLHHRFEWDDTIAGEKYREHQAAALIRKVKVKYTPAAPGADERTVRAFLPTYRPAAVEDVDDEASRTYAPTADLMADDFSRRLILADFEREWKAFRTRWQHLKEFADTIRRDVEQVA